MSTSGSSEKAASYGATANLEDGQAKDEYGGKKSPHGKNSVGLTACLIVADVVGAGIIGLPVAVAKIGWLPGVLLILLLLAMNVHISMLMWRMRMHFPDMSTFSQMAEMAFSKAPESQRNRMVIGTGALQYVFMFAMLGVYILSAGKAIGHMFYNAFVCLPTWTVLACGVILPFNATARRMGAWKNLVWLNLAAICCACLLPILFFMHQGAEASRPTDSEVVSVAPFTFHGGFAALSTFTFGFTGQFMVIEIISEMSDPSEFPTAYMYMSAPFQAAAFALVGIGGYYFIGDKAHGMIGDNVPFGAVFQVTFACLLVQMVTTYMIKGIVLCRGMHSYIDKNAGQDDSSHAWTIWTGLACFTALMAWLTANIVPFFNDLVDLIGASVTPVACYIIPIVCYLRFMKDHDTKEHSLSKLEGTVIALELTLAVLLLTVGTYFAVVHIGKHWGTYGPPFACHCEQMWNTCACSGSHVGMLDRCGFAAKEMAIQVREMVDSNFVPVASLIETLR